MLRSLLLSLLLFAQAPQPQGAGIVQGTVTRTGTAEGLVGVEVDLLPTIQGGLRGDAVVPPSPPQNIFAMTDNAGHFVIRNVPAGRYGVRIQSNGYSGAPTNTNLVNVTANGTVDLNLSAIPGAIIRGRVLDSSGQFLSNANVQAFLLVYQDGLPYLQGNVSKLTDDRGEYRLFGVPPGEYYIGVSPRPPLGATAPGKGTVRDVRTFFPSTENPDAATKITIAGGEQMTNVDVTLRSALHVRVSGRVISQAAPAAPIRDPQLPGAFGAIANASNNNARLQLVPRDTSRPAEMAGGPAASVLMGGAPGEFEISNVTPGVYDLYAATPSQEGIAMGRVSINVAEQDVTGLTIVMRPGVEVKGSFVMEALPNAPPLYVFLQPMDSLQRAGMGFSQGRAREGSPATFSVGGVPEGRFRLVVTAPNTHYVEDIVQNGRSIYDTGLEVGANTPDPIQVILKAGTGTVDGSIVDSSDKPVAGATVALVPLNRRGNPSLYRSVNADTVGNYSLRAVAPGEYKLFAWPVQVNGAFFNAAFLAKYEDSGRTVTVAPNGRITIKLPLSRTR